MKKNNTPRVNYSLRFKNKDGKLVSCEHNRNYMHCQSMFLDDDGDLFTDEIQYAVSPTLNRLMQLGIDVATIKISFILTKQAYEVKKVKALPAALKAAKAKDA